MTYNRSIKFARTKILKLKKYIYQKILSSYETKLMIANTIVTPNNNLEELIL